MRHTLALISALALGWLIALPALAQLPRKCVAPDGSVTYSAHRSCPDGARERIDSGSFSAIGSQTIVVLEPVFAPVRVIKNPVVEKVPTGKPSITQPITR